MLLLKLAKNYDDEAIAIMLHTARDHYRTRSLAFNIAKAQLNNWQRNGKSVDEVFSLLKLKEEGAQFFKSPALSTWTDYVTKLDKDQNPYQLLLAKLTNRYGEKDLVNVLIDAKKDFKSRTVAETLEKLQFQTWKSKDNTADNVFKLLRLNEDGDDVLKNPVLSFWISYVKVLQKNPDELLLKELKKRFSDENLMKILEAAKNNYDAGAIAKRLTDVQLQSLLSKGTTVDDMFNLLRLNEEGEKLFENPAFITWESYLANLKKTNPDETMFSVLKKNYGDEALATMVEKAKATPSTKSVAIKLEQEIWRSQDKTDDDIFKLLKLGEKENTLFETPEFATWMAYATKLDIISKYPNEFAVVSQLEKRYGDLKLTKLLAMTNRRTDSVKIVSDLQKLQFKQWMDKRSMNPEKLDDMLPKDPKNIAEDLALIQDFVTFYKANK